MYFIRFYNACKFTLPAVSYVWQAFAFAGSYASCSLAMMFALAASLNCLAYIQQHSYPSFPSLHCCFHYILASVVVAVDDAVVVVVVHIVHSHSRNSVAYHKALLPYFANSLKIVCFRSIKKRISAEVQFERNYRLEKVKSCAAQTLVANWHQALLTLTAQTSEPQCSEFTDTFHFC